MDSLVCSQLRFPPASSRFNSQFSHSEDFLGRLQTNDGQSILSPDGQSVLSPHLHNHLDEDLQFNFQEYSLDNNKVLSVHQCMVPDQPSLLEDLQLLPPHPLHVPPSSLILSSSPSLPLPPSFPLSSPSLPLLHASKDPLPSYTMDKDISSGSMELVPPSTLDLSSSPASLDLDLHLFSSLNQNIDDTAFSTDDLFPTGDLEVTSSPSIAPTLSRKTHPIPRKSTKPKLLKKFAKSKPAKPAKVQSENLSNERGRKSTNLYEKLHKKPSQYPSNNSKSMILVRSVSKMKQTPSETSKNNNIPKNNKTLPSSSEPLKSADDRKSSNKPLKSETSKQNQSPRSQPSPPSSSVTQASLEDSYDGPVEIICCIVCRREFFDRNLMKRHVRRVHFKPQAACGECGKRVAVHKMNQHKRNHAS